MRQVAEESFDSRDGWFIERRRASTSSELMATLSGLSSPFQPVGSSTRVNTAQLVNNYGRVNVRVKSWLEQYLKQQQEAAAEKKAAEEEAAEQAAFEAQKQAHKDNADFVYEGTESFQGYSAINPETGKSVNWFFDVDGGETGGNWMSGPGDDVIYLEGNGSVISQQGNDVVCLGDSLQDGPDQFFVVKQKAWLGADDDKAYGGKGTQLVDGGMGDDFIDLGHGFDIAEGGYGSDEFVVDLQNSGIDTIVDFVDAGDKISILNGGEIAQAGDWYLNKITDFTGGVYGQYNVDETSGFYEIRNSGNGVAAIFGIGMRHSSGSSLVKNYSVSASMDSSGIEILESSGSNKAEMDFV